MHRRELLDAIVVAGYHNDSETAIRLFLANRVSYEVYRAKFHEGRERWQRCQLCSCAECSARAAQRAARSRRAAAQ